MIFCPLCYKKMYAISHSHLKYVHGISVAEFKETFPGIQMISDEKREKTARSCRASGCGKWRKGTTISDEQKRNLSRHNSGSKNPFYGKSHSAATRTKMSRNHADFRGDNNPLRKALSKDPSKREKLSRLQKLKWTKLKKDEQRFALFRQRASASTVKAMLDGKCKSYGRGHEHGWFKSDKQKTYIYYRSSYEHRFLEWCEIHRDKFCACPFSVPYKHPDGRERLYLPDFLVDDRYVVEIKPRSMTNWDINTRKAHSAKSLFSKMGLTYCVITKEDIEAGCVELGPS